MLPDLACPEAILSSSPLSSAKKLRQVNSNADYDRAPDPGNAKPQTSDHSEFMFETGMGEIRHIASTDSLPVLINTIADEKQWTSQQTPLGEEATFYDACNHAPADL
jgi:hypothetical protein